MGTGVGEGLHGLGVAVFRHVEPREEEVAVEGLGSEPDRLAVARLGFFALAQRDVRAPEPEVELGVVGPLGDEVLEHRLGLFVAVEVEHRPRASEPRVLPRAAARGEQGLRGVGAFHHRLEAGERFGGAVDQQYAAGAEQRIGPARVRVDRRVVGVERLGQPSVVLVQRAKQGVGRAPKGRRRDDRLGGLADGVEPDDGPQVGHRDLVVAARVSELGAHQQGIAVAG